MSVLDTIFKAYDIRGRTDIGTLDEAVARRIGAAFAVFADSERIALGRDCRASSPEIAGAFIDGVVGQGVDVLYLGEVATDLVYFVSGSLDIPGAMITASHNPPEYNGIKLCRSGARPIGVESGLETIKQLTATPPPPAAAAGTVVSESATGPYVDHLFSIVDSSAIAPLRVAVDGGNGMAGVVLPEVFERLSAEMVGLYIEPDGTFPNHPPNPIDPENLKDLVALVTEETFDLGVAFDGDADRAFFIDDAGVPLSGSTTTSLVAQWFLDREPGAVIVHNLITSRSVPELVRRQGGEPVRTMVGHSYIKAVMAETDAVFGGEHSGHYYFRDNYRADSGMLAMLVLLQVLSEADQPLSELRKGVELYQASGEINIEIEDKQGALDRLREHFAAGEVDELDGLTIGWDDRWFNVRPSNTEQVLRVNVEAADRAALHSLVEDVLAVIGGSRAAH